MDIKMIIAGIFLGLGCFIILVAAIGVIRFPDFYTRLHPAGKGDTLGQSLVLLGLMIYEGFTMNSVKLLIIILFIYIVNPTATHFITRAAYLAGIKPWKK